MTRFFNYKSIQMLADAVFKAVSKYDNVFRVNNLGNSDKNITICFRIKGCDFQVRIYSQSPDSKFAFLSLFSKDWMVDNECRIYSGNPISVTDEKEVEKEIEEVCTRAEGHLEPQKVLRRFLPHYLIDTLNYVISEASK